MSIEIPADEMRTIEEIREHYEIEKALANRLRQSSVSERQHLYTALYNELFEKVPHHPQLSQKVDAEATAWVVNQRMQLLGQFLDRNKTFLEVGPGDCSLTLEAAKHVKKAYAVDVSTKITENLTLPPGVDFELVISDGCSVPVPNNSIDIVYSHQLMEHLHPEDANQQLRNIYKALSPGGMYICITPNRLSGPHDISQYFDDFATGFHLKEYTVTELYKLFRAAGFSKVSYYKSFGETHVSLPLFAATLLPIQISEAILGILPVSLRRKIAKILLFRGITIVGKK